MKGRYLIHSGIKGQKWGIRRYQYEDGSLTEEGKKRYGQQLRTRYNDKTYKKDIRMYGKNTANKINNKILKGYTQSEAAYEVGNKKQKIGKGLKIAGTVGTSAASILATAGYFVLTSGELDTVFGAKVNVAKGTAKAITGKTYVKRLLGAAAGIGAASVALRAYGKAKEQKGSKLKNSR